MASRRTDGSPRALDQARRPRTSRPADQRRRDIIEAAAGLFRERGYDATTVQEIASAAGVAAGTVYLHFASKDAVLAALQEDFEAGLLDRFSEIAGEVVAEEVASGAVVSNVEIVDRLVDGIVAYGLERRQMSEVIANHGGRAGSTPGRPEADGLTELLARVIREGVRLGHVHVSDPETAAYLLNLAAVTAIANAIAARDDAALARVVSGTKELYVKALAPHPPRVAPAAQTAGPPRGGGAPAAGKGKREPRRSG